jgi:hypothetical protein
MSITIPQSPSTPTSLTFAPATKREDRFYVRIINQDTLVCRMVLIDHEVEMFVIDPESGRKSHKVTLVTRTLESPAERRIFVARVNRLVEAIQTGVKPESFYNLVKALVIDFGLCLADVQEPYRPRTGTLPATSTGPTSSGVTSDFDAPAPFDTTG